MKKKIGVFILFWVFLFTAVTGFCDKVYLKNGRFMEGIIEKESDESIFLNVGIGKVIIKKNKIDCIEEYADKEQISLKRRWGQKYFAREEFVPARLRPIAQSYNELESLRNAAVKNKRQRELLEDKRRNSESELEKIYNELADINNELSGMNPKTDLNMYNSMISTHNSLSSQARSTKQEIDDVISQINLLDEGMSEYITKMRDLSSRVDGISIEIQNTATHDELNFLMTMQNKIKEMESDVDQHKVIYRKRGASLVVDVEINGRVNTKMIVDTGATMVVIPRRLAKRSGVKIDSKNPRFEVTVADGRKVEAIGVSLDSVKVGDALVKNVKAAVMQNDTGSQDGLLGMSFLEHFYVTVDAKGGKLILGELKL